VDFGILFLSQSITFFFPMLKHPGLISSDKWQLRAKNH
jgi:hypothetical protein